ncbi:MAG: hypothetical protein E5X89_13975 [Mesorhizobium sp.]|nr:MAG: hypothetical protein E5X88_13115 [Mesorhizobium sp.]TIO33813.1 MAG: hypothetical protein E5X89_13975 [Mesorhizobium sp.]
MVSMRSSAERTGKRMTPKIGTDFRKGSCVNQKWYSVLCASKRTRGAVLVQFVGFGSAGPCGATGARLTAWRRFSASTPRWRASLR